MRYLVLCDGQPAIMRDIDGNPSPQKFEVNAQALDGFGSVDEALGFAIMHCGYDLALRGGFPSPEAAKASPQAQVVLREIEDIGRATDLPREFRLGLGAYLIREIHGPATGGAGDATR